MMTLGMRNQSTMVIWSRWCLIGACCWLLAACAIIPKPGNVEPGVDNPAAWTTHKAELQAMQGWAIQGRVATGKLLGWTGDLSWRQQGERFKVRLSGPLGAGGFRATGTLNHVTIDTGKKVFRSNHPQRLVERILGWRFPLTPLRYWARGMPAPGKYADISVNEQGRLVELQQQGWKISYLDYAEKAGRPALPSRIVLDNGDTRIRMVVARWFDIDIDSKAASKENTRL